MKRRKLLSILLSLCVILAFMPQMAFAEEPKTPQKDTDGVYQIGTAAELYGFAELVNNGNTNASAVLTADITVNSNLLNSLNEDGTVKDGNTVTSWTPIGTSSNYTGKFDGQGHTISGLYFNASKQYVGLFGYLGENGEIKNVGVIDSYLQGQSNVGGVCGYNDGTISGCYNTGKISSTGVEPVNTGGVCGANYGTISDCYNTGTVSGYSQVGGICGKNHGGNAVTGCYNTGTVSGYSEIGGVCGYNGYGGEATITGCYNTGTVSGNRFIGGVCGQNDWGSTTTGCYNTGTVSGEYSGGVCGINDNDGSITGCFTNKDVVCGLDRATVTDCNVMSDEEFADGTVCNLLNTVLQNASSDVRFYQGVNTPEFINVPKLVDGVYQISCASELYAFAQLVNSGNTTASAVLTADITVNKDVLKTDGTLADDTSGFISWTPIGNYSNKYTGKFDGQGHTISGLYLNTSTNYVGLFGYLGKNGEVKNVGVIDSYLQGQSNVGGVCGYNDGTISGCYNTGKISSTGVEPVNTGGVCGANYGTISDCYNTGTVSGYSQVGGICGNNHGGSTVTGCYNTGTVSGDSEIGGVCGYNGLGGTCTITGCYNTGTVSGNFSIGGVCGHNENASTITGCYSIGTVSGGNSGGVCGLNLNGATITGCYTIDEEYTENKFNDGTVCKLLNNALQNASSDVRFYQGVNYPELILNVPKLVDGVYQISCASELYGFAQLVNSGNTTASAVLTANITVNKDVLKDDGTLADDTSGFTSWTPIGTPSKYYTGNFDGQGHTVSGLYFNNDSTSGVGLFRCLGEKGEIKNVGVIDSYFYGYWSVGGVCGYNGGGTITGCYNTGTVSGSGDNVGGVCGYNGGGTITCCYNTGTVSGNDPVGGICGRNESGGTVIGCYNTGTVSGNSIIGGVCGDNGRTSNSNTITGCYNTGTVSGNRCIGGVCGVNKNYSSITGCYSTGTVSGNSSIGGVCGLNDQRSIITGCYNTGEVSSTVSGESAIGGVCGLNWGDSSITGCFTNKDVVCGENQSTVKDCDKKSDEEFADGTVCGHLNTALAATNYEVHFYQRIGTDPSPLLTNHNLVNIPEKAPTYTEAGYREYWKCKVCGKFFSDEAAENEINEEEWKTGEGKIDKLTVPSKTDSVTSAKDGSVTVTLNKSITTSGSKTTAKVTDTAADQILNKLASSESKSVVIDATAGSGTLTSVVISESALKKLAEVEGIEITLVTDSGRVVLDNKTITSIAASAGNDGQVTLNIETVEKSSNLLKVDISISTSGGEVTDFNGGKVTVTVDIDDELKGKKPVAVYIDDKGKYYKLGGTLNEDGTFTFVTGHFSTYAIMPEADADKVIKDQAIAAVKGIKSTVTVSTKNVKKGIKVTVKVPASQKADKTGIIIYRSTKKDSGYAMYKKVKTSGSTYTVTNTLNVKGNKLVKGKKYYYKARVYKVIDGKTYYGLMSSVKYMKAK